MATVARKSSSPSAYGTIASEPQLVDGGWLAQVLVDDITRRAFIPSTLRAVRVGDMVRVLKHPTTWAVQEIITAHEPPAVSSSMGTKPPAASTSSASVPGKRSYSPVNLNWNLHNMGNAPSSYGQSWGNDVVATINTTRSAVMDLKDAVQRLQSAVSGLVSQANGLVDAANNIRSVTNTNATRINQAADYASTASDAIGGVVGALKDERIVK